MAELEPTPVADEHSGTPRAFRVVALTGVLLLAFFLRVPHAGAGFPYLHHWNEPESASTALRMMTTGDLNPHFFNYGSLPIYLNLGADVLNYFRLMGKPALAESHLSSLEDIEYSLEPKKRWFVSHPSFYYGNRLLSVVFGVATVLCVYFLGVAVSGPAVGLIAAFWLAVLPVHITHSARITPDVLVTLLTLNVVLFSVRFLNRERLADLATAFAFAGLASATKYNAATMMILPLALLGWAALRKPSSISLWQATLLLLLPGVVFAAVMPYAVLDLPSFLRGAGSEVRHYKVDGHGPMTIEPGLEQIRFQAAALWANVGPLALALGLAGAAFAARQRRFLWMVLAPAVYFLFMIQMRANFHRNFLVLYPYLALAIALGVLLVHRTVRDRAGQARWGWLGVTLGAVALLVPTWQSVSAAQRAGQQIETRSEAVLRVNQLKASGVEQVVIASELGVHPMDLKKLELPYRVIPTAKIRGLLDTAPRTVFALPEDVDFSEEFRTPGQMRLDALLDRLTASIPEERVLARIGGEPERSAHHTGDPPFPPAGVTRLDFYSVNPVILLVSSGGERPVPDASDARP